VTRIAAELGCPNKRHLESARTSYTALPVPHWPPREARLPPMGRVADHALQGFAPSGNADTITHVAGNELSRGVTHLGLW
jgi:hypothetical protein